MDERIGCVLYQSCQDRGSVKCVSVFGLRWCGWCRCVGGEWVEDWTRIWRDEVALCLCDMWARIICVDGRSRYPCIVLGGYLRI